MHDWPRICWCTVTGHSAGCWRPFFRTILRYRGEINTYIPVVLGCALTNIKNMSSDWLIIEL